MKKNYLKSFCARCLTLLVLALLSTNLAWGETETKLLCGGSFIGSFPNSETWIGSDADYYSGNGYKFDTDETLQSPDLTTGVKKVTIKILVGYNGYANSTLKVGAYSSTDNLLAESDNIVPTVAYNAQTDDAIQEFTLDGGTTDIRYIKLSFKKTSNYGMKTLEVYDATGTTSKTLVSIAISGTPTKIVYGLNDSFSADGLTATGHYDDGTDSNITSSVTFNSVPAVFTEIGENVEVSVTATLNEIISESQKYIVAVKNMTTASIASFSATSGSIDSNIDYAADKGDGTTNPAINNNAIRIYKPSSGKTTGGTLTVTAKNSAQISNIIFSFRNNGSIKYKIDDGDLTEKATTIEASSQLTIDDLNATSVTLVNVNTGNSVDITAIEVTYTIPETTTWTVSFDANGGTGAPTAIEVNKTESINEPSAPTRSGFDFAGWTLTKDGTDVVSFPYTPTSNVTLYAKWTAQIFDITANAPVGGFYTVKIGDAERQTIDKLTELSAAAGTTITMTIQATDGYKVKSTPFTVATESEGVKVSKSGENYSFTMPGKAVTITANYAVVYTISKGECTNGTITKIADKDDKEITGTSYNSKVVVTVTPDEHYKLSSLYFVNEGEDEHHDINLDDNGEYSFTMPENNVTVYATFAQIPTHEAKFFVNGVQLGDTQNVFEGEDVVFPETTPEDIASKTFVGWSASAINGTTNTPPIFVTTATMKEEALSFYAVYADVEQLEPEKKTSTFTIKTSTAPGTPWTDTNNSTKWTYSNITFDNSNNSGMPNGSWVSFELPENAIANKLTITKTSNAWSTSNISIALNSGNESAYITFNDAGSYEFTNDNNSKGTYKLAATNKNSKVAYIAKITVDFEISGTIYSNYCTFIPAEVTITTAKYATLGLPYAVTIPEGVSAYTATVEDTKVTMTKIQTGVIPAKCGVILYADVNEATTYTFYGTTTEESYPDNKLVAVTNEGGKDITGTEEGIYFLSTNTNGVVFKLANSGNIPQYKAYLQSAGSEAKLDVVFGEPTGITSYENDNENENLKSMTVYNLQGVRVNNSYKGIVIMNGKKYINK